MNKLYFITKIIYDWTQWLNCGPVYSKILWYLSWSHLGGGGTMYHFIISRKFENTVENGLKQVIVLKKNFAVIK